MQLIFMERNEAHFHWPGENQQDLRINHFQCKEHTTQPGVTSRDLSQNLLEEAIDPAQIDPDAQAVQDIFSENTERSVTILSQRLT